MKHQLDMIGFHIIEDVYTLEEANALLELVNSKDLHGQFGVREFLVHNPDLSKKVFTDRLKEIINQIAPNCTKAIKSIYFDKPPSANWVVNWHQDLTINLANRKEVKNFKNWRVKDGRTIVQPNTELLENIFTIRIHLDHCTHQNGALRVFEKSHTKGVFNIKAWLDNKAGRERVCEVSRGGLLIIKPLLVHSSRRTENEKNRRVIHIEFTDQELPTGLVWKEMIEFKK